MTFFGDGEMNHFPGRPAVVFRCILEIPCLIQYILFVFGRREILPNTVRIFPYTDCESPYATIRNPYTGRNRTVFGRISRRVICHMTIIYIFGITT